MMGGGGGEKEGFNMSLSNTNFRVINPNSKRQALLSNQWALPLAGN